MTFTFFLTALHAQTLRLEFNEAENQDGYSHAKIAVITIPVLSDPAKSRTHSDARAGVEKSPVRYFHRMHERLDSDRAELITIHSHRL